MGRQLEELGAQEKRDLVEEITLKKTGRSDKDWIDLRDEYDLDISPDTLRKAGVGIKLAVDADMLGKAESSSYLERQKMRDLTANVNAMYRKEARSELLREEVAAAIAKLEPLPPPIPDISYTWCPNKTKELVVCVGDIHYGADIHVTGLYGEDLNVFNDDVFRERMGQLLSETCDILAKERITKVHLFLVGDLIDGMLRQSQLMRLQYGLVDSTMRFSEYMATWINKLSESAEVNIASCSGNHSEIRPLGSKKRQFPEENMERLIMWYLKARLADNPKVSVDERCELYSLQNVLGFSFLLFHGDSEKNLQEVASETVRLYGRPIDFFICGHRHRENEYPTGCTPDGSSTIIRVSSVCGADSYATSKGYGGKPGATAIVMEEDYGRRCVYPIQLGTCLKR